MTLTFHPPRADAPATGTGVPAVIVMPGGRYIRHAQHEGKPVAEWLGRLGFAAWVLEYPVGPGDVHPAQLDAARAAMRQARAQAPRLGVDPARIGVIGFSAGGHLAALLAAGPDTADDERPAFAALCYAATSWHSFWLDPAAPDDPAAPAAPDDPSDEDPLIGPGSTPEKRRAVSVELIAVPRTPPTFVWHCADDELVSVDNALSLTRRLAAMRVPVELHVFPTGGHGLGLAEGLTPAGAWTSLCADWLRRVTTGDPHPSSSGAIGPT